MTDLEGATHGCGGAPASAVTIIIHIVHGERPQALLYGLAATLVTAIVGIRLHMEYERERDETEN